MSQDAGLRLTLSLHTNPGVYALLLGSGISRSAQIPTGWDIVLDLTRRVAAVEGQSPDPDPEAWYRGRFGEEPDYSKLLARLTMTPTERMTLLRSYFEPDEDERELGLKQPTPAHRAIAGLVKHGYIRVILTTNFDRLLELALQDEGVTPDVIGSEDGIAGAMPYVHSRCVIVKLHGDYRDTRIRNTIDELSLYTEGMNSLLDRIFDDFGLIICGWSGDWDTALRASILRSPNRRFPTFWLGRGQVRGRAKELVEQRRAETITIESADNFLPKLLEQLESLRELQRPAPLSTAMAVATVKRYLADPVHRIRLHDLITDETERVHQELGPERFPLNDSIINVETYKRRVEMYEAASERLIAVLTAVSFFGEPPTEELIARAIERLVDAQGVTAGSTAWIALHNYPALLLTYASGIAAIAAKRYRTLATVLNRPQHFDLGRRRTVTALTKLNAGQVGEAVFAPLGENAGKVLSEHNPRVYTPISNHLHDQLRSSLRPYLQDDERYSRAFDSFEVILALAYMDGTSEQRRDGSWWSPPGAFIWRRWGEESALDQFERDGVTLELARELLNVGFFGGTSDRFFELWKAHREFVARVVRGRGIY